MGGLMEESPNAPAGAPRGKSPNAPAGAPRGKSPQNGKASARGARRHRRKGLRFARFFTKQLLACIAIGFILIVVDLVIFISVAIHENDAMFNETVPSHVTRDVNAELVADDSAEGTLRLSSEGQKILADHHAWALVMDEVGQVILEEGVPDAVPRSFDASSVAMAAHYGYVGDYSVFFWDRGDSLLMVGFPPGSYWQILLYYPEEAVARAPFYILLTLGIDLAIMLVFFLLTRQRTVRAIDPIGDALESLSEGKPTELALKGDLKEVGASITETSRIMQEKDQARELWIRGISHDVRTPLSIIVGYADEISQANAEDDVRESADRIKDQALKIKGLVADLNTASHLVFANEPLTLEAVNIAQLLRALAAETLNNAADERYPISLVVEEGAGDLIVEGDARLLRRAFENVLANARVHNSEGCAITCTLSVVGQGVGKSAERGAWAEAATGDGLKAQHGAAFGAGAFAQIVIADDGVGIGEEALRKLRGRIAVARTQTNPLHGDEHGLGLLLVDRIVALHGGDMALSSHDGFQVRITLPCSPALAK